MRGLSPREGAGNGQQQGQRIGGSRRRTRWIAGKFLPSTVPDDCFSTPTVLSCQILTHQRSNRLSHHVRRQLSHYRRSCWVAIFPDSPRMLPHQTSILWTIYTVGFLSYFCCCGFGRVYSNAHRRSTSYLVRASFCSRKGEQKKRIHYFYTTTYAIYSLHARVARKEQAASASRGECSPNTAAPSAPPAAFLLSPRRRHRFRPVAKRAARGSCRHASRRRVAKHSTAAV